MTTEEALQLLRRLGRERAFGRHVGSDRLIQAGLEALLAGVESPSIPRLAGLGRREAPEAAELFDAALEELGLFFRPPTNPVEAKWAMAYWIAEQISDGSLDAATGSWLIWAEVADALGNPEELQPVVQCAMMINSWDADWDVSIEVLKADAVQTARDLLRSRRTD